VFKKFYNKSQSHKKISGKIFHSFLQERSLGTTRIRNSVSNEIFQAIWKKSIPYKYYEISLEG
jgi:hypothetical protein